MIFERLKWALNESVLLELTHGRISQKHDFPAGVFVRSSQLRHFLLRSLIQSPCVHVKLRKKRVTRPRHSNGNGLDLWPEQKPVAVAVRVAVSFTAASRDAAAARKSESYTKRERRSGERSKRAKEEAAIAISDERSKHARPASARKVR